MLWNLSKNRGHECHLLSLETYGSRRKGGSACSFTSFTISQAGIEMEQPVPATDRGAARLELWVRDLSKGCAQSCHLCLLQKSRTRCFVWASTTAGGEQGEPKPQTGTVGQVTPSSAQPQGWGFSALTTEACPFSCWPSTAVPVPQCHTRPEQHKAG